MESPTDPTDPPLPPPPSPPPQIEIEFNDSGRGRNQRITDHYQFTLGALGETGSLFACPSTKADEDDYDSKDSPSTVHYRPFDSWTHNSEWTVPLPKGEDAQSLAIGRTFAAVATNKWIRVFRHSGAQVLVL